MHKDGFDEEWFDKDGFDEEWFDKVVISKSINATGANPAQHSSTAVAIRNALLTHFHTQLLNAMHFYLISLYLILYTVQVAIYTTNVK